MSGTKALLGVGVVSISLLFFPNLGCAQGTVQWTVTFDGPPPVAIGTDRGVTSYYEDGMLFTPIGSGQFGRSGGGQAGFAEDGTAYLYAAFTESLAVSSYYGERFGLVAVDLAEFSTLYQTPLTVPFIGYRPDGSTVVTEFVTDGIIDGTGPLADFQTFYFDSRFADLTRVEMPTYGWSLDNMVFSTAPIPEPGVSALLLLGAALLGIRCFERNRRS